MKRPAKSRTQPAIPAPRTDDAQPFGHFSDDGMEYVITDALRPPRAQINFFWNDTLISGVNQFGSGEGIFNDRTLMLNHPAGRVQLIRHGRRFGYLRDLETGRFWSTGLLPARPEGRAPYECRVGLGYSEFHLEHDGIRSRAVACVAPDEPVEIWEYTLTNASCRARRLWLCPYVEWDLGGYPTFSSKYSYFRSTFDAGRRAVLSFNTSNERPHPRYNAFLATDGEVEGWCGAPRQFLGAYGHPARPDALVTGALPGQEAWCEDLAAALAIRVELPPGAERNVAVLIGSFDTLEEKDRLIAKVLPAAYRTAAHAARRREKRQMAETVAVETPDRRLDTLTNVWLKQQTQLCVEFGRDGARGFRDTLQDAWAAAPFQPSLARAKLVETMRHQHADGHGIRGWMPLQPHHYSDGPVWLAMAVCAYLKETGDFGLLNESVPFLDGGAAPVLEHVLCGLRFLSSDSGPHGLVLAHEGDWNDSLNWLCKEGKGESVWTSMGLYHGLGLAAELADEVLRDSGLAREMRDRRAAIAAAIQAHAWDGAWYLAGYNDLGEPVGSHRNDEGQVYLNPQTWAVMTGLATGERLTKCLAAVDDLLESDHGSLTLCPPYTREHPNVGRVSVLLPGMYENGTPYCHGTAFKIVADCCAGRADAAYRSWRKVMPDSPEHPSAASGCEPYAFTNQYLGPTNGRAGASISGWITGSAGWMFRAVVEYFAGIQPDYRGFRVCPCLPSAWPAMRVRRPLRGRDYEVRIERDGATWRVTVDGRPVKAGEWIPYAGK
jgi:cellobiose phosphorylase